MDTVLGVTEHLVIACTSKYLSVPQMNTKCGKWSVSNQSMSDPDVFNFVQIG
jgi:hypothetical protein